MSEPTSKVERFFVSFAHRQGFGSCEISGHCPKSWADVEVIRKKLEEKNDLPPKSIVVINWQKFESE